MGETSGRSGTGMNGEAGGVYHGTGLSLDINLQFFRNGKGGMPGLPPKAYLSPILWLCGAPGNTLWVPANAEGLSFWWRETMVAHGGGVNICRKSHLCTRGYRQG